jgi:hypothetical protein
MEKADEAAYMAWDKSLGEGRERHHLSVDNNGRWLEGETLSRIAPAFSIVSVIYI